MTIVRRATAAYRELASQLGDPVMDRIREVMAAERLLGQEEGREEAVRALESFPDELDLIHVEIEALLARLDVASRSARAEAWATEPTEGETSVAERLSAYRHGLSAGLALAATWLRRSAENIPSNDDDTGDEIAEEESTP